MRTARRAGTRHSDADDAGLTRPACGNLTPVEAAELLRVSVGTLRNWRYQGRGPRYVKSEGRALYPIQGLNDYLAANMHDPAA